MSIFILCAVGVINANADCWDIYDDNITKDGWGLCIKYTNWCDATIRVKVTYKVAYKKRYCNDAWSYETITETCNLYPNRSNYRLVGSGSPTYDDCTRRYKLISYEQID